MEKINISDLTLFTGFVPVQKIYLSFNVKDGDNDFEGVDLVIRIDEMTDEIFFVEEIMDWDEVLTVEERITFGNEVIQKLKNGELKVIEDISFNPLTGKIS